MRLERAGHIINISSSSGRFGSAGSTAYSAAKWAVSGFSEALAREVRPFGVKVVAVEPGSIRTNWTRVARGHVPELLTEYEPSIGEIMRLTENLAGNEPGDPAKVAAVIFDLSRRDVLPEHLILGSDAIARIMDAEAERARLAAEWDAVSRSTDFPAGT
jgi:NAD(P)-dependent dehydrogenase (short-subunit alcohol dehydrogenase family)